MVSPLYESHFRANLNPIAQQSPYGAISQGLDQAMAERQMQQKMQAQIFLNRLNELRGKKEQFEIEHQPEKFETEQNKQRALMAQALAGANLSNLKGQYLPQSEEDKRAFMRARTEYYNKGGRQGNAISNAMKQMMERQELVNNFGEDSPQVKSFDNYAGGKGRQPPVVKLENEYRNALQEYNNNPSSENKKKVDDYQKALEKNITSPTALAQLNNIKRALSIAPKINYDPLVKYAGPKGIISKFGETITSGTSKEREAYETEKRKLATLENELALALKIPADKSSREHFHELFNPSGIGMTPKATKNVLKNTIKNLLQQAKDMQKNILLPTYGAEEHSEKEDWSQYERTE
jgi:hypothetical protein